MRKVDWFLAGCRVYGIERVILCANCRRMVCLRQYDLQMGCIVEGRIDNFVRHNLRWKFEFAFDLVTVDASVFL